MNHAYETGVIEREGPAMPQEDVEEDLSRRSDEVYTLKPLASEYVTARVINTRVAPFRFVDEDAPEGIPAED